jgi:hypothetical protein
MGTSQNGISQSKNLHIVEHGRICKYISSHLCLYVQHKPYTGVLIHPSLIGCNCFSADSLPGGSCLGSMQLERGVGFSVWEMGHVGLKTFLRDGNFIHCMKTIVRPLSEAFRLQQVYCHFVITC